MDSIQATRMALMLGLLLTTACGGGDESNPSPSSAPAAAETPAQPAPDDAALVARGQAVYRANCVACHAYDPTKTGAVAPALAGSSLELLEYKVLRNEYPPGYTPKRTTGNMVALPHLEKDLPALAAYLQSFGG